MGTLTTHGACGKTWHQAGNRTSHCGGCHETFTSLSLFDLHRRGGTCAAPEGITHLGRPLLVETRGESDGVWYSPAARAAVRTAHQETQP